MKLLVVMANYPFPPRTGSAIVAYNTIKFLSNRHHVDLVCLQPMNEIAEPAKFVSQMEFISQKQKSKPIKWLLYFFYMLIDGKPPSVSASASRAMAKKVRNEIHHGKFDAILLFEMGAIQYFPSSIFHKLFVNIEDPQSIKLNRMAKLPIWSILQKTKLFVQARFTAFYENRMLHRMAKVFLLSEADILDMKKKGAYKNLAYMPYGVEQRSAEEIAPYEERESTIVFSGNMFHPPNVDAGLFLLKDIFPLILRVCPSAVLWIVGANPDVRIYEAAAKFGKQVVITGRVNDMSEYIKRATVSICPVRLKIGVQTKILEALSWGTPVVTTIAGNSGIGGVSGTHLWAEDDADFLAKRVCDLFQGHGWEKMSEDGRRLVAERFTWEGSVAQLEKHLETLGATC